MPVVDDTSSLLRWTWPRLLLPDSDIAAEHSVPRQLLASQSEFDVFFKEAVMGRRRVIPEPVDSVWAWAKNGVPCGEEEKDVQDDEIEVEGEEEEVHHELTSSSFEDKDALEIGFAASAPLPAYSACFQGF
jgi:hypothetical protein